MPLSISRNDILKICADAIVNPTDHFLTGSGGTDYQIRKAGGKDLDQACRECLFLETGEVFVTASYQCKNCHYIFHTCGPVFSSDSAHCEEELRRCYTNCLKKAAERKLASIAFPLISSGTFAFPKGQALRIATDAVTSFLLENEMQVYLLVYDKEAFDTASRLYRDIQDYLKERLETEPEDCLEDTIGYGREKLTFSSVLLNGHLPKNALSSFIVPEEEAEEEVEENIFEPDESFSECMIRLIDQKGMLDPEVYKRANIDRKHFNHIKNNVRYRPKKETAVALAIGMRLSLEETNDLLEKAGFVLSRSSRFDLIIRYCLEKKIYDIYKINEILFEEDEKTLGC